MPLLSTISASAPTMEAIHPALWRASQVARADRPSIDSGHLALNRELAGGWPLGQINEILLDQSGTAELRLLAPALRQAGARPLALLCPPYVPQASGWCERQPNRQLLWIPSQTQADSLWAAEQILRHGSCAVLLLWQTQIRHEALRRLQLAANTSDTLFCLIRPASAAQQPSPAPLRIRVSNMSFGLQLRILKRRGAVHEIPIPLYLPDHPYLAAGLNTPRSSIQQAQLQRG